MGEIETSELLEKLFDSKKLSIIRLFLNNKEKAFYMREISKECKVPVATTFRIINQLVELGIIAQFEVSRVKLYRLADNKNIKFLESFLRESVQIIKVFTEKVKQLPGIVSIVQHGKEEKDRVNMLLIGEHIDAGELKRICAEIKEQYKFSVYALALTQDQFNQMSNMGLYSGDKKVIYQAR